MNISGSSNNMDMSNSLHSCEITSTFSGLKLFILSDNYQFVCVGLFVNVLNKLIGQNFGVSEYLFFFVQTRSNTKYRFDFRPSVLNTQS
jgi:hypothetical protein